jgi:hypothetical protein
VEAEEIWPLSFLPSASVSKKQQSSSQRQQAQGKLNKSCSNEREREREREAQPGGPTKQQVPGKQTRRGGHAYPPTQKKLRRAAGQVFFCFWAPNNAFHLSSLMTIFIKKMGGLSGGLFFF